MPSYPLVVPVSGDTILGEEKVLGKTREIDAALLGLQLPLHADQSHGMVLGFVKCCAERGMHPCLGENV